QSIPAATATASGVLSSTVTVPSFNHTFKSGKITVQLDITFPTDKFLKAVLIAPDGTTQVTLFDGVGGTGANFTGTIFDDAGLIAASAGTAPFTGTFKTSSPMGLATFNNLDVEGTWTLQITNTNTG